MFSIFVDAFVQGQKTKFEERLRPREHSQSLPPTNIDHSKPRTLRKMFKSILKTCTHCPFQRDRSGQPSHPNSSVFFDVVGCPLSLTKVVLVDHPTLISLCGLRTSDLFALREPFAFLTNCHRAYLLGKDVVGVVVLPSTQRLPEACG